MGLENRVWVDFHSTASVCIQNSRSYLTQQKLIVFSKNLNKNHTCIHQKYPTDAQPHADSEILGTNNSTSLESVSTRGVRKCHCIIDES